MDEGEFKFNDLKLVTTIREKRDPNTEISLNEGEQKETIELTNEELEKKLNPLKSGQKYYLFINQKNNTGGIVPNPPFLFIKDENGNNIGNKRSMDYTHENKNHYNVLQVVWKPDDCEKENHNCFYYDDSESLALDDKIFNNLAFIMRKKNWLGMGGKKRTKKNRKSIKKKNKNKKNKTRK